MPLSHPFRALARSPSFAASVVLTLAIGIGASTLLFSVIDGVLLAPLPYPDAERIVVVAQLDKSANRSSRVSDPNFADLKAQTHSLATFAQYDAYYAPVAGGDEPVRTIVADVSAEFFAALAVQPAFGRPFVPEEQVLGAPPTALVSYRFWQRYLGGTQDFAARTLRFGNRALTIVGVMPQGFHFPDDTDVWSPREQLWPVGGRMAHSFFTIGRLAPNVSLDAARGDFTAVAKRLALQYGDDTRMSDAEVVPLRDDRVASVRLALIVLAAAATLLYIVAVANSVNLLLARAIMREREHATRLALGARRMTLACAFLAEALALCGLAAALGLLIAWAGTQVLASLDPGNLPRGASIRVDAASVGVASALALFAAVALSLLVSWRTPGEAGALGRGARSSAGRSHTRLRDGLVAAQIAIALVLAIGAALLGRSYWNVANVDPGFQPAGMLLMDVTTPYARDRAAQIRTFHERVLERLRALPGVTSVGAVSSLPLRGAGTNGSYVVQSSPDEIRDVDTLLALFKQPERTGYAEFRVASEEYFQTLGIPVLRGRAFQATDTPTATHVAVVSRSLADSRWPGENPLGKLVQFGGMDGDLTPFTIVGVVGDVQDYGLDRAARPTFYAYYRQRPTFADQMWFAIRVPDAQRAVAAAREVVRDVDRDVPPEFLTSEQWFASSIAARRFNVALLGAFGGTALLLSLAGVYGAMAFSVARRSHELGIRVALGANSSRVVALVLGRGLAIAAIGIAIGVVVAFGATRVAASLLFGVAPHDPMSYAAAAAMLLAACLIAAVVPALGAARVDPMTTLRQD